VISALLLLRVHPRPRGAQVVTASVAHELRAGWHEFVSRPWVWVTVVSFAGAVLALYTQWYALAPGVARDIYKNAGLFGVIESVAGAGAVLGALIGVRWSPDHPLRTGILLSLPWPVMTVLFALHASLGLVIASALVTGFGFSLFGIWWETSLARYIPPEALSRVSSYDWVGSLALMPLGFAIAGPLALAFGARSVLIVGSVIAFALLALALAPRSTRELGGERSALAQQLACEVGVAAGGEPQIAHVDTFVGVVNQRRDVPYAHVPVREEPVRDTARKGITKPARVGETG
jgi:hypothetical protein